MELVTYQIDKKSKESMGSIKKIDQYLEFAFAISSGLLTFVAFLLEKSSFHYAVTLYAIAFLIGGYVKAKEGLMELWKEREFGVDLLMMVAAIGAASIGYWLEGALLIFIFSLSGALETYTMARSERDLSKLLSLQPEVATIVYSDGSEAEIPVSALKVDDVVVVRPGGRIPVDGVVLEGSSEVDQASITGESIPVAKVKNDEVYAGTMNSTGSLFIKVTVSNENSLFAKIVNMVDQAREEVPESQLKMERLEKTYAKVILLVTSILLFAPHFIVSWSWSETFYRAMVFLVVASPCALVASIMPAILSAMSNGSRKGILFKNGMQLEVLSEINVVAFDKTGTLTEGKPKVTDIVQFVEMEEIKLLQAVASIEWLSEHPIARAVVSYAKSKGIDRTKPEMLQAETGYGVKANYRGEEWRIGKPEWFFLTNEKQRSVQGLEAQGKTVVIIERDKEVIGAIALKDTIRNDAKSLIQSLHKLGIHTVMLTGDQKRTAEVIADELGIKEYYSGLLPQDKVHKVKELRESHGKIAMVGDGVNDAPALSQASMGIAMGAGGSDIALETADVVLMNDKLSRITTAVSLSKRMKRIVRQNLIFAATVIILLLLSNFTELINLPLGVVGHEGSTILVILNGLRLLR
ncbi:cadmium-translocating P-type ATPase [Shimazuella sp. AN120528]|uniref:heavy metal translocating P-type ATPase n=1 Tax=Shimazuella soli TaxID=1892854 RepID=UPI001F0E6E09|nr:heavy metal translocating P-type ATPase [Shimazuella soli]MCH5585733.1 cadmium-translocating P-type ATPase [Shimazuella soli]